MAKINYYLNGFTIKGLRNTLKGEIRFDVTMKFDEDGILKVKANKINGENSKSMKLKMLIIYFLNK